MGNTGGGLDTALDQSGSESASGLIENHAADGAQKAAVPVRDARGFNPFDPEDDMDITNSNILRRRLAVRDRRRTDNR